MKYTVIWASGEREFRTFENAERFARYHVAMVNERGFSEPAVIMRAFKYVAVVRLDSRDRVWTDLYPEPSG